MVYIEIVDFIDLIQFLFLDGQHQILAIPEIFSQPFSLQASYSLCYPYHFIRAFSVEQRGVIQVIALTINILPLKIYQVIIACDDL